MKALILLPCLPVIAAVVFLIAINWRDWRYGKPHIVRFEDGTYGVRRWDVFWEVLGRGKGSGMWHWWSAQSPECWDTFATDSEARAALVSYRKERIPRADVGRKV